MVRERGQSLVVDRLPGIRACIRLEMGLTKEIVDRSRTTWTLELSLHSRQFNIGLDWILSHQLNRVILASIYHPVFWPIHLEVSALVAVIELVFG